MPAASTSGRPLHERVAVFFDELFRLDPLRATATGDHRFDAEWPDMSEDGRRARLAFIDRWEAEFAAVAPEGLSADEAVNAGVEAESADADVRFVLPRLRVAAATTKGALDQFEVHLREVVLPGAEGEGRLGRALFETKMRHTLKSDLSPAEILERANREYVAVRREMIRLAREAWPRFLGDRPRPTAASAGIQEAADSGTVRAVLDAIAAEHQAPEAILDFCREELRRVETFC